MALASLVMAAPGSRHLSENICARCGVSKNLDKAQQITWKRITVLKIDLPSHYSEIFILRKMVAVSQFPS